MFVDYGNLNFSASVSIKPLFLEAYFLHLLLYRIGYFFRIFIQEYNGYGEHARKKYSCKDEVLYLIDNANHIN